MKRLSIIVLLLIIFKEVSLCQIYSTIEVEHICEIDGNDGSITIKLDESQFEPDWVYPFNLYILNTTNGESTDILISNDVTIINNLDVGIYEVVIDLTDLCELSFTEEILFFEKMEIEFDITPSCDNDGTIQINASEGQPPYSILWEDGSTDKLRSNLHQVSIT